MNGSTITPGMIDAHSHLMFYGITEREYVNLRDPGIQTVEDVVAKIEQYLATARTNSEFWPLKE